MLSKAKNEGEQVELVEKINSEKKILSNKTNEDERLVLEKSIAELELKHEFKKAELRDNQMAISILNTMSKEVAEDVAT
jgi:hypothetical protein